MAFDIEQLLRLAGIDVYGSMDNPKTDDEFEREFIRLKKIATDNNRIEVMVPDNLGLIMPDMPEATQFQYYKFLLLHYGFFNPVLYVKKQRIRIFMYNDGLTLAKKFSAEDKKLLATIHTALLYKQFLLPVRFRVNGFFYSMIAAQTNRNMDTPLPAFFVFADEYRLMPDKAKNDLELFDYSELGKDLWN